MRQWEAAAASRRRPLASPRPVRREELSLQLRGGGGSSGRQVGAAGSSGGGSGGGGGGGPPSPLLPANGNGNGNVNGNAQPQAVPQRDNVHTRRVDSSVAVLVVFFVGAVAFHYFRHRCHVGKKSFGRSDATVKTV